MDYQFKRDLLGQHTAKFSMGHEAFGHWLTDEIGKHEFKIKKITQAIKNLKTRVITDFEFNGLEFNFHLTRSEAEVFHHQIFGDEAFYDENDHMSDYQEEIKAECGFEDFSDMFADWREFIET